MDSVITRIEIDLYYPTSYEVIKAQQGDNNSRIIEAVILNQGEPYILPTKDVVYTFEGHRGDGSNFIKYNCTVNGNVISITLDEDILYANGTVEAKIVMSEPSTRKILSPVPIKIRVQKNPCDKNQEIVEKKSVVDDLIFEFNNAKAAIDNNSTEVFVNINEAIPSSLRTGDFYLQEY